jgi:exonuclease VII large subunit
MEQPETISSQSDRQSGIASRVRESTSSQLTRQKDRATDSLGSVAQAVRQSTNQLREQRHDTIAQYIEQAANQLDRLSTRLREKNVNELLNDAQRLARQRPALFIGSAFALGLIGARFFKSSSERAMNRDRHPYPPQDRSLNTGYGVTEAR